MKKYLKNLMNENECVVFNEDILNNNKVNNAPIIINNASFNVKIGDKIKEKHTQNYYEVFNIYRVYNIKTFDTVFLFMVKTNDNEYVINQNDIIDVRLN
jgi:ATP sulfurylase